MRQALIGASGSGSPGINLDALNTNMKLLNDSINSMRQEFHQNDLVQRQRMEEIHQMQQQENQEIKALLAQLVDRQQGQAVQRV